MWSEIDPLPRNWKGLALPALPPLLRAWQERRKQLEEAKQDQQFLTELRRRWAIETGLIEGLYSLDRGMTETLVESGFLSSVIEHDLDGRPEDEWLPIVRDQEAVVEMIMDFVGSTRDLSKSYIHELHVALTAHQRFVKVKIASTDQYQNQELLRGQYKRWPNNPTRPDGRLHEYCPPEQVESQMDALVHWYRQYDSEGVPVEVISAWLHHRFTQIHPYMDGNGRLARVLASVAFIRAGWFPIHVDRDDRAKYISALETADAGDLASLVEYFGDLQTSLFNHAMRWDPSALKPSAYPKVLLGPSIERLRQRVDVRNKEVLNSTLQAVALTTKLCWDKLAGIREWWNTELKSISNSYFVDMQESTEEQKHWFVQQVISLAQGSYSYYADLRTFHRWIRMRVREERACDIVFSWHSLGHTFFGVVAVAAYLQFRGGSTTGAQADTDRDDSEHQPFGEPVPLAGGVFQFEYSEASDSVKERFAKWLEDTVLSALDKWRKSI